MAINLTLIVQSIHFFIAYMLLSRLVLKPGLALIRAEQREQDKILTTIALEQSALAKKQEYKQEQWRICKHYFAEHTPTTTVKTLFSIPSVALEKAEPLAPQKAEKFTKEIVSTLKARIVHD